MTPLMLAASRGGVAIVQALLAKGANVRKTDYTGRDALDWAAESHRPAIVQLLAARRSPPLRRRIAQRNSRSKSRNTSSRSWCTQ